MTHDGWAPYRRFWRAAHQLCLAHLLRRCRELLETAARGAVLFPRKVKALLAEALAARDERGAGRLSPRRAEHALRPAVVNRKVWGGNRTWAGARAQAVLMSVLQTAKLHGTGSMDFLSRLLRAPAGHEPLLIPA